MYRESFFGTREHVPGIFFGTGRSVPNDSVLSTQPSVLFRPTGSVPALSLSKEKCTGSLFSARENMYRESFSARSVLIAQSSVLVLQPPSRLTPYASRPPQTRADFPTAKVIDTPILIV